MSAVAALVNLFYIHEKSAYEEEVQTDAILDGKKEPNDSSEPSSQSSQSSSKSKSDEIEETVAKRKCHTNRWLLSLVAGSR